MQRILVFARDLAYGAITGLWSNTILIQYYGSGLSEWYSPGTREDHLTPYLETKWNNAPPSLGLLESLGFLTRPLLESDDHHYMLTEKAFDLLAAPLVSPSVFVSYKKSTSSELALLIEARLKLADSNIQVFIDKQIEPGDSWARVLEKNARSSRVFICLLAPDTIESEWVQKEIAWAQQASDQVNGHQIIPLCHRGYEMQSDNPLSHLQAITVRKEDAAEYEQALSQLLNRLGYSII
jgi:hypothetical protein